MVFHEANRLLDDATHGKMSEGDWGEVGIGTAVFGPTVVAAGKGLATVGRGIWSVGSAAVSRASAFNAEVGAAAEAEGAAPIVAEGAEGALVVSETALAPLAVSWSLSIPWRRAHLKLLPPSYHLLPTLS